MSVAVYCGSSSGTKAVYTNAAISVGRALAKAQRRLIYGGGVNGIMGAVSKAVLLNGGSVTGVLPYAIAAGGGEGGRKKLAEHEGLTPEQRSMNERVMVHSMHERKVEMARRSVGFAGLPGGLGTFEEILEVATWTQLGIHRKRQLPPVLQVVDKVLTPDAAVVLLNVRGFYDPLRALIKKGVEEGFIMLSNAHIITFVDGPASYDAHDTYDWGSAMLTALEFWKGNDVTALFPGQWNDSSNENLKAT
ncbi:hypothetical protein CYLTODRAFT_457921 [Cylindrobasidium torrendii FP15055 ss-10]|uniref:Cytokinin riboside 5'-monophosphate phosphoribohydrolase n=1 Tax=Cylindrobasidium torrendii FP15055 ss-10 TaxID=1314674 RepID=A0A0D7B0D1_9AGAR|nr:hypothetical protein CYLTODRAFT_457921 [Cylindrobasidium torrendii FP15055 ss-10]